MEQNKKNIDEMTNIEGQQNQAKSGTKKSGRRKIFWTAGFFLLVTVFFAMGILILRKDIKINPILADTYAVHGVDVSHYQGTIDWETLSRQNLDFAVIKATEGSTHIDDRFVENWQDRHICTWAPIIFLVLTVRVTSRRIPLLRRSETSMESLRRSWTWNIMGTKGAIRQSARRWCKISRRCWTHWNSTTR